MKQIMDFSDSRWAADSLTALEVETEFIDALEDAICGDQYIILGYGGGSDRLIYQTVQS